MTVVVTARVPDGLAAWASEYATKRDVPRAVIVEGALEHFRALCETGVPDLPERRGQGRPKAEEATPSPRREQARRVLAAVQAGPVPSQADRIKAIEAKAAAAAARAKAERERKYQERGW